MRDVPRITTILQSLDSVRYFEADPDTADEYVARDASQSDLGHARSEILGAMIFGHEIMVPATVVGDCPAFKYLLREVLGDAWKIRLKASERLHRRYHPFRVGVEARRAPDGMRIKDYDSFLTNYVSEFSGDRMPLVEVGRLARSIGAPTEAVFGNAAGFYLSRDFEKIDEIDENYGLHCRTVQTEFGADSPIAAPSIEARPTALYGGDGSAFKRMITECCGRASNSGHAFPERSQIEDQSSEAVIFGLELQQQIAAAYADRGLDPLAARNPAASRGFWYKRSAKFGSGWEIIKNWLDRALYNLLIDAYDIGLPSYFTQPIEASDRDTALSLAFMDNADLLRLSGRSANTRILPPAPDTVPWLDVWDFILRPDVDKHTREFQATLCELRVKAMKIRRQRIKDQSNRRPADFELYSLASAKLRDEAKSAVLRHVGNLSKIGKTLSFSESGGRISVSIRRQLPPLSGKTENAVNIGLGVLVGAGGSYVFGDPAGLPMVAASMLVPSMVEEVITPPIKWTIDAVLAPKRRSRELKRRFEEAEIERLSYWMTPQ